LGTKYEIFSSLEVGQLAHISHERSQNQYQNLWKKSDAFSSSAVLVGMVKAARAVN
jgi:hypothetical protein